MNNDSLRICDAVSGPMVTQLHDETSLDGLRRKIQAEWPIIKNSDNFPGSQPVSLAKKDLMKLQRFEYSVCEKTDGMRYLLYGTIYQNRQRLYLVDRAYRFYEVRLSQMGADFFQGTILDGELVREHRVDGGPWSFYCHDCVCLAGVNIAKSNLDIRLAFAEKCVSGLYTKDTRDPFTLKTKRFWDYKDFGNYLQDHRSGNKTHDTDGLVLTPKNVPVCTGTQLSMFKWKEKHTFDFAVHWTAFTPSRCKYDMFVMDKSKLAKYHTVNSRTPKGKVFDTQFRQLYSPNGDLPTCTKNVIVECLYENDTYIPVLLRKDKLHPNGLRTVTNTHSNITEDIKLEELLIFSQNAP